MENSNETRNGLQLFLRHWEGRGKLSTAYWGYGVVGSLVLLFIFMIGSLILAPLALKDHKSVLASPLFNTYLISVLVLLLAYHAVVWVLIWRNAGNTSSPLWGKLAKAVTALSMLNLLRNIVALAFNI